VARTAVGREVRFATLAQLFQPYLSAIRPAFHDLRFRAWEERDWRLAAGLLARRVAKRRRWRYVGALRPTNPRALAAPSLAARAAQIARFAGDFPRFERQQRWRTQRSQPVARTRLIMKHQAAVVRIVGRATAAPVVPRLTPASYSRSRMLARPIDSRLENGSPYLVPIDHPQ
jgi:hypothetical protein